MYPSVVVQQVEQGIRDFLRTTFAISTPHFHGLMEGFLSGNSLFAGPYLSLALPFKQGKCGRDRFPSFTMKFVPHAHQEAAFNNLSGPAPVSTLVATGTGSGKTECFLYPVLHHCWFHRHESGVKAVLIYPMNALAPDQASDMDPEQFDTRQAYLLKQYDLWFHGTARESDLSDPEWRTKLGEKLKGHLLFQNMVKELKGRIISLEELWDRLSRIIKETDSAPARFPQLLLGSLISLISLAQRDAGTDDNGHPIYTSLVDVRVQHWLRELGRMVVSTGNDPKLVYSDDLTDNERGRHLPVVHCRECGAMGWLGVRKRKEDTLIPNLRQIYTAFFSKKDLGRIYLFPENQKLERAGLKGRVAHFCGNCLHINAGSAVDDCSQCGSQDLVAVFIPEKSNTTCPYCEAHRSLTLLGSRAASLTSVMISQLYASTYNDDKKLITFSDNVQDAAHRAGFFGARTWGFNLRVALQRVVDGLEGEVALSDLPGRFVDYWQNKLSRGAYIATFIAPNMEWFADYDHLISRGQLPHKTNLIEKVNKRLYWEIISEYAFDSRIGRTLEKSGVSMVLIAPEILDATCTHLKLRLENEVEACRGTGLDAVRRLVCGVVNHLRTNGAVYLPVLKGYLNDWGNDFLLSTRIINWMQGIGPTTRAPKFLTNRTELRNAKGTIRFLGLYNPSRQTWCHSWVQKIFFGDEIFDRVEVRDILEITISTMKAQANYLQRIGRAGRKTGNALNLTVANLKPHDLYFFTDPLVMLEGSVQTPGVFLDAAAVLERQLEICWGWGYRRSRSPWCDPSPRKRSYRP